METFRVALSVPHSYKLWELPTRWGNQLNGNSPKSLCIVSDKLLPTRWGNQLNGNFLPIVEGLCTQTPHSVGKPIEWKRIRLFLRQKALTSPHSLGKPIEWKPELPLHESLDLLLPTRWGNQLNGNCNAHVAAQPKQIASYSPLAGETN